MNFFEHSAKREDAWLPAVFAAAAVLAFPLHGPTYAHAAFVTVAVGALAHMAVLFRANCRNRGSRPGGAIFAAAFDGIGVSVLAITAAICGGYGYLLLADSVEFCDSATSVLHRLLRLLGEPVGYSNGVISHDLQGMVIDYRVTLSSLNADAAFFLVPVALMLDSLGGRIRWKRVAYLLLGSALLIFVRLCWNYALHLEFRGNAPLLRDLMYHPVSKIIGIALVSLFASGISDPGPPASLLRSTTGPPRIGRRLGLAAGAAVFVAAGIFVASYKTVGVEKGRRILIDDFHSGDWEMSLGNFEVTNSDPQLLYSFIAARQLLEEKRYAVSVNTNLALDALPLTNWDVVILKTPTRPYSDSENAALHRYVERGGGLWVVGDHTDLLGMTKILNRLLEPWKVSFNSDACNDLSTGYFSEYNPVFGWPHPLTAGMHPLVFLTSCSLECSSSSYERVILGYSLLSDPVDYSVPSFFGDMSFAARKRAGLLKQCLGLRIGAGRVVVLADSTPFSTFCLYEDGHDDFLLRCVEYLRRRNSDLPWLRPLLLALWAGGGGLTLLLCRRRAWIDSGLLAGALAGVVIGRFLLGGAYESRASSTTITGHGKEVAFLRSGVLAEYPLPLGVPETQVSLVFNSVRLLPYEMNIPSRLCSDLEEITADTKALVIAYPTNKWTGRDIQRITRFVEQGGNLVVIDSQANETSTVNPLFELFGSRLEGFPLELTHAQLIDARDGVNVWMQSRGKGKLYCICDGERLSDQWLGNPFDPLSEWQSEMKAWLANLFSRILGP